MPGDRRPAAGEVTEDADLAQRRLAALSALQMGAGRARDAFAPDDETEEHTA
jgi:hypothetical protein